MNEATVFLMNEQNRVTSISHENKISSKPEKEHNKVDLE